MRTGAEVGGHSCELGGGRPGLPVAIEAGEGQGRTRPQHLQEETSPVVLGIQLVNCAGIRFCCLQPPAWQSLATTALGPDTGSQRAEMPQAGGRGLTWMYARSFSRWKKRCLALSIFTSRKWSFVFWRKNKNPGRVSCFGGPASSSRAGWPPHFPVTPQPWERV